MQPRPSRRPPPSPRQSTLGSCPAATQPVSAFQAFYQEQRPLLSGPFTPGEAEKLLSQRWKELSKTEKTQYKVNGVERRNIARSPYNNFCQAQRPLLPPDLRNAQREATLGKLWAGLSEMEKAKYAPVTAASVLAQALPTASLYHRSAPPPEEDSSRGKRAKTAAREAPSAALTTAPLSAQPLAPAPPVTVATAVEGTWEAMIEAAAAAAATPYVLASTSPTASLASTSTSTDNRWEEVLEEVLGPDSLFNSLEALLENALEVCGRRLCLLIIRSHNSYLACVRACIPIPYYTYTTFFFCMMPLAGDSPSPPGLCLCAPRLRDYQLPFLGCVFRSASDGMCSLDSI